VPGDVSVNVRGEIASIRKVWSSLDRRAVMVLTVSAVLVLLQMRFGSRTFYRLEVATALSISADELHAWGWWFGVQGILGFLIPVFLLRVVSRLSAAEMGLGLGDWRFASTIALVYVPLVLVGTWILSDGTGFQQNYPHLQVAAHDWNAFLVYEALFLFYWIGWEYLWRGFVLFGTRHVLGYYAIFVQALPFAVLHYAKPLPEALLSVVGGVALGALVWRSRSFWIAVPVHWMQMVALDLFCSLRIRTGVSGWGLNAVAEIMRHLTAR
jgi:hypothetical protein